MDRRPLHICTCFHHQVREDVSVTDPTCDAHLRTRGNRLRLCPEHLSKDNSQMHYDEESICTVCASNRAEYANMFSRIISSQAKTVEYEEVQYSSPRDDSSD